MAKAVEIAAAFFAKFEGSKMSCKHSSNQKGSDGKEERQFRDNTNQQQNEVNK